jgi:hypothetical protein
MITLKNMGKAVNLGTAFAVFRDGVKLGTAYRAESGDRRGNYSFGEFNGSRARLLAHVEAI